MKMLLECNMTEIIDEDIYAANKRREVLTVNSAHYSPVRLDVYRKAPAEASP